MFKYVWICNMRKHMDLCTVITHVHMSGRPIGWLFCMAKTLTLDTCTQTFLSNFVIPAMLIGIMYIHHFMPLSLQLEVTRWEQSKSWWLHFLAHFSTDQVEIWGGFGGIKIEHPQHPDFTFDWRLEITIPVGWALNTLTLIINKLLSEI